MRTNVLWIAAEYLHYIPIITQNKPGSRIFVYKEWVEYIDSIH